MGSAMTRFGAVLLAMTSTAACGQIPGTDDYKIRLAQEAAAETLLDPTSALFRDVEVNERGNAVCGEVNGKNRMGAYVGFTRFYATNVADRFVASLEPEFDSDYLNALEQSCRQIRQAVGQSRAHGFDPGDVGSSVCREAEEYSRLLSQEAEWSDAWAELCLYGGELPEDFKQIRATIEQAAAEAAAAADAAVADMP